MLNINYGHNEELLNKCKPLKDYSIFTTKVKDYRRTGLSLEDAIDRAIDECIEEGVAENRIIDKLMLRFQLDIEKAQDYVQKYK